MNKGVIISIVVIAALLAIGIFAYIFSQQSASSDNDGGSLVNQPSQSSNEGSNTQSAPQNPQSKEVLIKGFAFSPSTINIKVRDSITWTNQDSASHTVTSDSGSELSASGLELKSDSGSELNSELLSQGESYSHTFNTPGTYSYHCTPHPGMKAKVIVS